MIALSVYAGCQSADPMTDIAVRGDTPLAASGLAAGNGAGRHDFLHDMPTGEH